MNKIAIVEDRLKNAVLIARQLQDWLIRENLDNVIELKKVLLFSVSEEAFRTEGLVFRWTLKREKSIIF